MALSTFSPVPNSRDLMTYQVMTETRYNREGRPYQHAIALCVYPDCIRRFDGTKWDILADKRAS